MTVESDATSVKILSQTVPYTTVLTFQYIQSVQT